MNSFLGAASCQDVPPHFGADIHATEDFDWSRLNVDASTLKSTAAARPRPALSVRPSEGISWSSTDKPNGSAVVTGETAQGTASKSAGAGFNHSW